MSLQQRLLILELFFSSMKENSLLKQKEKTDFDMNMVQDIYFSSPSRNGNYLFQLIYKPIGSFFLDVLQMCQKVWIHKEFTKWVIKHAVRELVDTVKHSHG